jgi:hypothetical protein
MAKPMPTARRPIDKSPEFQQEQARHQACVEKAKAKAEQKLIEKQQAFIQDVRNIHENVNGTAEPIILPISDMMLFADHDNHQLHAMKNLMYDVESANKKVRKNKTGGVAKQKSRFQIWISKGSKQFQKCINKKMTESQRNETFETFLVGFYKNVFKEEESEFKKLIDKQDLWHVVLVGLKILNCKNNSLDEAGQCRWTIISAITFFPMKDMETIFLSWIGTSFEEKASKDTWGYSENSREFFDGKLFMTGKGLGSFMISAMQCICKSSHPQAKYETIVLQSLQEYIGYYRTNVGMRQMIIEERIDQNIINDINENELLIESEYLHHMRMTGNLNLIRPPNVHKHFHEMNYLLKKTFFDNYCEQKDSFDFAKLPDGLIKEPDQNALYPSVGNTLFKGSTVNSKLIIICDEANTKDVIQYTKEDFANMEHSTIMMFQLLKASPAFGPGRFVYFSKEDVGLVLTRLLLLEYRSQIPIQSHGFFCKTPQPEELCDYDPHIMNLQESKSLEQERLFLIQIIWYISKMEHGVEDDRYYSGAMSGASANTFYKCETDKEGKRSYIHTCQQQEEEPRCQYSQWEEAYMNSADFIESVFDAANERRVSISPEKLRIALRKINYGLAHGEDEYDTSQDAIFLLLSMVFNVSFVLIKFWKSGINLREFSYVYKELCASKSPVRQIYVTTDARIGGEHDGVVTAKNKVKVKRVKKKWKQRKFTKKLQFLTKIQNMAFL